MDPQRWQEIRALFDELVELGPDERVQRLATVGAGDAELRASVEHLLASDADASARLGAREAPFLSPGSDTEPSDPFGLSGQTLSHFRVLSPLEAGGMGMVYRAEDTRLNRVVALKFLLPQYHLDSSAKARFLHEARSAAALDHPNLCTVYEVGESEEGRPFLAMALYPGETLRARLARDGALPIDEALEIARQIAEGLACAHEAGIVHRDLKPGNLMLLPNGTVKILDFGLAKARDLSLTGSGATLGTVAYMAPEQIQGGAVDGRADLWALGVVLYEVLTGKRPFGGEHELSIAHAIVHQEPLRPSALQAEISPPVEELLLSLLRKDGARRPATAEEVLEELAAIQPEHKPLSTGRRAVPRHGTGSRGSWPGRKRTLTGILAAAAVLLVARAGLITREIRGSDGAEVPTARSVAVLPFENQSAEKEANEYLAAGLQDEVITQLGKVGDLKVISRNSTLRYADTEKPLRQVGQELGVDAILEGSVRRSGERVLVTAQLVDARTDEKLWEESYDRELKEFFSIQTEIAQAITTALQARLSARERAGMERVPTQNREAWDRYMRGQEYHRQANSEVQYRAAERFYQGAVELDPQFALAHARLSAIHMKLYNLWFDRTEARRGQWRAEAETALRLQPDLPEAHLAMGFYWFWGHHDFERGLAELEIARRGMPGDPDPRAAIGYLLGVQGRSEKSAAEFLEAIKLDPLSPSLRGNLAYNYAEGRRYPEAAQAYDRAIELGPDYYGVALDKGWLFVRWRGNTDSLAAALQRLPLDWDPDGRATYDRVQLARLQRRPAAALAALQASRHEVIRHGHLVNAPRALLRAQVHDGMGNSARARADYEAARAQLERMVAETPEEPRLRIALGEAYAGLGRKEEAIREAQGAEQLIPLSFDLGRGASQMEGAARIFTRVGEKEAALQRLERLMRIPFGTRVSAASLRLDPAWDPLRSEPRFQRLVAQGEGR